MRALHRVKNMSSSPRRLSVRQVFPDSGEKNTGEMLFYCGVEKKNSRRFIPPPRRKSIVGNNRTARRLRSKVYLSAILKKSI
jgi:hypothetical protein